MAAVGALLGCCRGGGLTRRLPEGAPRLQRQVCWGVAGYLSEGVALARQESREYR